MLGKLGKAKRRLHRCLVRSRLGLGVMLTLLLVAPAQAQSYETALASAADAIAAAIGQAKKERIAVIDFEQIEGQVMALGRFLAEEISTDLAGSPRPFKVIDRATLQSILAEHALSMSGLVNPENAKRLGQIAGIDALVLGTYTDFGESYRLSLKAIATNTAEMVATAKINVPKNDALVHLAAEVVDQPALTPTSKPSQPTAQVADTEPRFIDTFDSGPSDIWTSESGDWQMADGYLVNKGDFSILWLGHKNWSNYIVEFDSKSKYCGKPVEVLVRMQNTTDFIAIVVAGCNNEGTYKASV